MANYLPVLLGSFAAVPDDSVLEDVWRSWRNMTRLKNEIANGVRLENASWRTWWKKRNGLKTVTPETLNWLKDSDVTWLYGPLHTAIPPPYTPKPSPTTAAALDLPSTPSPTLSQPPGGFVRKPILKHRSISELLTSDFPLSPLFSPPESDDETQHPSLDSDAQDIAVPSRPSLMHTKSDTHITRWGPNRAFRRDSPPRIIPACPPDVVPQKRKHISFNTFVEQCIAIDQPQKRISPCGTRTSSGPSARSNTLCIDKELVTIALIAPTILKTKADEEDYPFPHLQAPCHQ
ncbi:hypothetical protein F5J12DRAFT_906709 [Pisolithus orientalis]|uniref:uncharacterized protein n=1 Tax=Pisolithus orientalis TaxID=936130 RepID=UPI0022258789|nr:uncharacterized protein F5J12DRAFT_906709 [Pisolithus orientalis]KAI5999292.1 hypothetical protein F5J12DRAFT_906709 [Pisolithus orientalis]